LSVRDYGAAKQKAAAETAARYSRGNASIQNGWFLDRQKLTDLSARADDDMKFLAKKIHAN
jgi:hypothetical protein